MQDREPRRRVLLAARMRLADGWVDVSIRNLSSRGMMIKCPHPQEQGASVEIRRGAHVVIARTVWCRGDAMGLYAEQRIALDGIADPPEASAAAQPDGTPERRHAVRPESTPAWRTPWLRATTLGTSALIALGVALSNPQPVVAHAPATGALAMLATCHRVDLVRTGLPAPRACDFGLMPARYQGE